MFKSYSQRGGGGIDNVNKGDKNKELKKDQCGVNYYCNFTRSKQGEANSKKFGEQTYHWCHNEHGKDKKLM